MKVLIYYVMIISLIIPTIINGHCIDIHSHIVSQGLHYVPGPNSCTVCICDKGNPKWCKSVLCSPPQDCQSFQVGNSCCEFKCLDDILNKSENYSDTYDMALRLIASLVTAVLSLSLLFFLIHRLRQRKIRLSQNSQLNDDHHSFNGIGYITGSLGYLSGSMGYLSSANNDMEYHYNESNYPFWKPSGNYFPRGEAPPPYEEAVRAARTEANLLNMNTNVTPFSFTTSGNENVSLTLVHNTHVNITPNVQAQSLEPANAPQYNMMLQTEQHSEPITIEDRQLNNASTNLRLVCRQSTGKNCTVNSSSTLVQNAMLVNQVDVHSDNGVSLPIVMLASNKTRPEKEQMKNHYFSSKGDISTMPQPTHAEKPFKNITNLSTTSCSKSSNFENRTLNNKFKSSNIAPNELKTSKASTKVYLKNCEPPKTCTMDSSQSIQSVVLNQSSGYVNGSKHRTIPQIYSTALNIPIDPDIWVAEQMLEKKNVSKDMSNSYKTYSHSSSSHDNSCSARRNDISMHCTLPKSLRDLNNAFNLNFNYQTNDEQSTNSETKDNSLPTTALLMKGNKNDSNCELYYTNIETLKNKLYLQSEKRNLAKNKTNEQKISNSEKNKYVSNQELQQEEMVNTAIQNLSRVAPEASTSIEAKGTEVPCQDNSLNPYYCTSPIQDLDDYRSECENCKSLSFENCSEEMDVLNETMTLQRHPAEQDENQMYYRTSLTLPSHSKKVRSVMLNTSRESWFMAMQEITSSSDSD